MQHSLVVQLMWPAAHSPHPQPGSKHAVSQRFSYKPHVQNASLQRDLRITRHQTCPLLLGQVSVEGGKQRKEGKGGKKASRASTPATDAATSGGEDAEDRWDFECIECGQEGDPLLCCEVRMLTRPLLKAPYGVAPSFFSLRARVQALQSMHTLWINVVPCEFQAVWPAPSPAICLGMLECKLGVMDMQPASVVLQKCS